MRIKDQLSDQEKIECFDKLCAEFYLKNFGHMSKSDFELLMFHFYIQKINELAANGEAKNTDYAISKELGISQQRVRNLKVRHNLVYQEQERWDWKADFSALVKNATLDGNMIIINIRDPNLFIELKNHVEEQGSYVDIQLNNSIFKIKAEQFLELILSFEGEDKKKEIIKSLKEKFKGDEKNASKFTELHPFKKTMESIKDISEISANIISMFSPTNVVFNAFKELIGNVN